MRTLAVLLILAPPMAAFAEDRYSTAGTPFGRQAVEAMPVDGVSRELAGRQNSGQRPRVRSVQYEDESLGRDSRYTPGDPRGGSQTVPNSDRHTGWPTSQSRNQSEPPAYRTVADPRHAGGTGGDSNFSPVVPPSEGGASYRGSNGATSDAYPSGGTSRSIMPPAEDNRFRRDLNQEATSDRGFPVNRWAQSNSPDPSDLNPNTAPPDYGSRTGRDDPYGRSAAELSESSEGRRYPLTMLLLFASIGLNVYLFWISLDTYNRYQDLVNDMRGRRSKREALDGDFADRPAETAF